MFRNLEQEVSAKRTRANLILDAAKRLDLIAQVYASPAWPVLEAILNHDVDSYLNGAAWGTLDDEAKRQQGRALRSKELLEYFKGAETEAERLRYEADRMLTLLEVAADQGRIARS